MRVIKTYEELKSPKEMIDSFMVSRRVSKLDKELSYFKNKYIESIPKIVLSNVHDNHIPVGFYECRIKLRGDLIRKCFTDTDANISDVMNNSELLVIFNSSATNFLVKIILKSDKNIYNHFKVTGISNYPLLSSTRDEISLRISQNINDPDDLIKAWKF